MRRRRGRRQGEAGPRAATSRAAGVAGRPPGERWVPRTVRGGRRWLCNPQPPRPPSSPACVPPSAWPALGSLSVFLSPVFQTGSAGLSVTCRRVPGWKSEVAPVPARGPRRKPVPGEESALREQGGRLVQVRGWVASPRAGRWAVTQSLSGSAAPALQPHSPCLF